MRWLTASLTQSESMMGFTTNIKAFLSEKRSAFAVILAVAVLAGAAVFTIGSDDAGSLASEMNDQIWIDVEGTSFTHSLKAFDDSPVTGPTGKQAFRAELCFWTRDGKVKPTPTPVLLNQYKGEPEPTYCPDCDRLVVPLNPPPLADVPEDQQRRPPPRREER